MTVSELIETLKAMPQDKKVIVHLDGNPRGGIEGVFDDADAVVIVSEWVVIEKEPYSQRVRVTYEGMDNG